MNTIGFRVGSPPRGRAAQDAISIPAVESVAYDMQFQVAKFRIEMLRVGFLPARKP